MGMESEATLSLKYTIPNKLNNEPYGTLWKVMLDGDMTDYYIQMSYDSAQPKWEKVGLILQRALEPLFCKEYFIDEILLLFENKKHNSIERFIEVVRK